MLYCVMEIPLLFTLGRSEFEISTSVTSLLCHKTNFSCKSLSLFCVCQTKTLPEVAASGLNKWAVFGSIRAISVQSYCMFKPNG